MAHNQAVIISRRYSSPLICTISCTIPASAADLPWRPSGMCTVHPEPRALCPMRAAPVKTVPMLVSPDWPQAVHGRTLPGGWRVRILWLASTGQVRIVREGS